MSGSLDALWLKSDRCAHCAAPGRDRCASCRVAVYCSKSCQSAAWPAHKTSCKHLLAKLHGDKPIASEREFMLEFWQPRFLASFDVGALLPPEDKDLDYFAAFERCRDAAIDEFVGGYSTALTDGARRLVLTRIMQPPHDIMAYAKCFIDRLDPFALRVALAAGTQPGGPVLDVATLLRLTMSTIATNPYVCSSSAASGALEIARLVLARAQPGDWLAGSHLSSPLTAAAYIPNVVVSQAVLDCIRASPGGFPAHAVAASPRVLHVALQYSSASFVKALLDAGADPNGAVAAGVSPLHALAASDGGHAPGSSFSDKLSLLLAAGARLEAVDARGWTPLVVAAMAARTTAFKTLLAAGSRASALRVNIFSDAADFETVLHEYAQQNYPFALKQVIQTGVLDVDVRAGPMRHTWTPLHVAAAHDSGNAVRALLGAGADPLATDDIGRVALQVAIGRSCVNASRALVDTVLEEHYHHFKREAVNAVVVRHRAAAAAPGDAVAARLLADAKAVAALLDWEALFELPGLE